MSKRGVRKVYDTLVRERTPYILSTLETLGYTYVDIDRTIIINPDRHNNFTVSCNEMFSHKHWVLANYIHICRVYFTYDDDRTIFILRWGTVEGTPYSF